MTSESSNRKELRRLPVGVQVETVEVGWMSLRTGSEHTLQVRDDCSIR